MECLGIPLQPARSAASQVFHTSTNKLQYTMGTPRDDNLPIMAVKFRPAGVDSQGARHVLLAVGADGSVRRWHVSTGRLLFDKVEKDNEVFACDYRETREMGGGSWRVRLCARARSGPEMGGDAAS